MGRAAQKLLLHTRIPDAQIESVLQVNSVRDGILAFVDPVSGSITKNGRELYFHTEYQRCSDKGMPIPYEELLQGTEKNLVIKTNDGESPLNFTSKGIDTDSTQTLISAEGCGFSITMKSEIPTAENLESVIGAIFSLAIASTAISSQQKICKGRVDSTDSENRCVDIVISGCSDGDSPIVLPNNEEMFSEAKGPTFDPSSVKGYWMPEYSRKIEFS